MKEQLKALFEGTELSDDFKGKVESLIESRVEEVKVELKEAAEEEAEAKYSTISEDYAKYLVTEMEGKTDEYIAEELVPTVERYLDYAVGEFMKEHAAVVESKTKVELADKFLSGMKAVTEGYNVVIPEGQDDVVADLQSKLDESNKRLDDMLVQLAAKEQEIVEGKKADMVEEVTENMTDTTRERFEDAAKDIKFVSEDQYKAALADLYESFAPSDEGHRDDKVINEDKEKAFEEKEQISEGKDDYLTKLGKALAG